MDYNLLLTCIFSGFFLAAPIGPVNLICIRRTLTDGYIAGLTVGLGAAAADMVYGYAAAAGLSVITDFILQYHTAFRWGGGLFSSGSCRRRILRLCIVVDHTHFYRTALAQKSDRPFSEAIQQTGRHNYYPPGNCFDYQAVNLTKALHSLKTRSSSLCYTEFKVGCESEDG